LANRDKKRRKLNRKTSNRTVGSVAPQGAPPKRSRKQKVDADAASMAPAPKNSIGTPLRIPYGNKEVALNGARYGSEGWYAPPGVDLSAFGERGWLL
jgi:DNA topoisomerase III